ncbi:MAG: 50S ribosomal protein L3 [Candidatus Saccharimonadales bacterium]
MADQLDNSAETKSSTTTAAQPAANGVKALLGRKLGMTQIFTANGEAKAVTLIQAGPCVVTAVRDQLKDGYQAVQIGYGEAKRLNQAQSGHLAKSGANSAVLREIRGEFECAVGDTLDVNTFVPGEKLTVSGVSKGKGFAGTIKRHNFSRGPMSHGSRNKRRPGSIGSMYPQKIFKGKKMAGRMGNENVTLKNLSIEVVDSENHILAIAGAVPGRRGSLLLVKGQN